MVRRSAISVFALAVAFVLGMLFANRPETLNAQPQPEGRFAGPKKCIGVAASQSGATARAFRAFDDGTVEVYEVGSTNIEWRKLGK